MNKLLISHDKSFYDKKLRELMPSLSISYDIENPPLIYGAGIVGRALLETLKDKAGIEVRFLVDQNSKLWGNKIKTATVISPKKAITKFRNSPIIVASVIYETEITQKLIQSRFKYIYPMSYLNYLDPTLYDYRDYFSRYQALFENDSPNQINQVYDDLEDNESRLVYSSIIKMRLDNYYGLRMDEITSSEKQYFDEEIITLGEKEIFVDGGAYDGDTIKMIRKLFPNNEWDIVAFEPDPINFTQLSNYVNDSGLENVTIEQAGLWSNSRRLSFFGMGTPESGIGEGDLFKSWSGEIEKKRVDDQVKKLSVLSLDEYFSSKISPTYIKMDIEGAELKALEGAKKLIKNNRPKLAICIYHKPADLWEIPRYIKKLNPEYRLYVRHYSHEVSETVLYAI